MCTTVTKTLRVRVKDRHVPLLRRMAREVNTVWNYCNQANRDHFHKLLQQHDFDVLIVERKDRLTRFGFRWFEALAPFRIEVVNLAEDATHDLMEDLVAIITSFAARLYGKRRGRRKTQAAIEALKS